MRRSHHTRCLSPTKRSDLGRLLFVAFAPPIVAPGCLASRRDRFPGFALLRCLRVAASLALVCDHREYALWCSGSYDFAFASSLLPLRRGTPTASPGRRAALPSALARFGSSACLPSVNDASPRFAGSSTRVLSLSRASPASSGARRVDSNPDFFAVVQARLRVVRDLRAVVALRLFGRFASTSPRHRRYFRGLSWPRDSYLLAAVLPDRRRPILS